MGVIERDRGNELKVCPIKIHSENLKTCLIKRDPYTLEPMAGCLSSTAGIQYCHTYYTREYSMTVLGLFAICTLVQSRLVYYKNQIGFAAEKFDFLFII